MSNLGTSQPIQQPDKIQFSSTRGRVTIRSWEASGEEGKANIIAMGVQFEAEQLDFEITESFGKSRIEVIYGFDPDSDPALEAPAIKWESHTNRITKEVYQSPDVFKYQSAADYPITVTGGLTNALLVLRACVNATNLIAAEAADIIDDGHAGNTWDDWFQAYNLMIGGTTEIIVFQSVLTKVETVSANYIENLVADDANLGCVFSAAQMVESEGAPEAILQDLELPDGLPAWDGTHDAGNSGTGFHYGYLKNNPDMVQQAQNKWTITTHYEQGIYAMFLFRAAIT